MKSICFIPARGGSKGVYKKNIRKIAGEPLIAHSIKSAKKSKSFEHIIVSTDDTKIANIAKKYGADVPFLRPKNLATDKAKTIDVVIHGIKKLRSLEYEFDAMMLLDCTTPLLDVFDIKSTLNSLIKKKPNCVAVAYKQHLNPYFNMVEVNSKGFLQISKKIKKPIYNRQNAPTVLQLIGTYAFFVRDFLKHKSIIMPKTVPYEISPEKGVMIDSEIEFILAEIMLKRKKSLY